MTINNPVLEAAKAKFGKVICYSSRLDGAHRLAILRDDAPLPHVPYMAITAWPDRQNGGVSFVYGHYDLTEDSAVNDVCEWAKAN